MQIPRTFSYRVPDDDPKNAKKWLVNMTSELVTFFAYFIRAINKGITFGDGVSIDNIKGGWVTFTSSATPDQENTVAHNLGAIPVGWIIFTQDKAGSLYLGVTTWDKTNIYVKCNVASVTFKLFLILGPSE